MQILSESIKALKLSNEKTQSEKQQPVQKQTAVTEEVKVKTEAENAAKATNISTDVKFSVLSPTLVQNKTWTPKPKSTNPVKSAAKPYIIGVRTNLLQLMIHIDLRRSEQWNVDGS